MIVPVFNYHSSIITIMGKSNKALYINIPSNFRYVVIVSAMLPLPFMGE